ncbi:MAG: hypothetical protein R2706_12260 [Acidimicrobiales bacterium]
MRLTCPQRTGRKSRHDFGLRAVRPADLAGVADGAKATALYERRGAELQLDAIAWLWPVIDDATIEAEIERRLNNAATETARCHVYPTTYGERLPHRKLRPPNRRRHP